jgi:hypothetical protein
MPAAVNSSGRSGAHESLSRIWWQSIRRIYDEDKRIFVTDEAKVTSL